MLTENPIFRHLRPDLQARHTYKHNISSPSRLIHSPYHPQHGHLPHLRSVSGDDIPLHRPTGRHSEMRPLPQSSALSILLLQAEVPVTIQQAAADDRVRLPTSNA